MAFSQELNQIHTDKIALQFKTETGNESAFFWNSNDFKCKKKKKQFNIKCNFLKLN